MFKNFTGILKKRKKYHFLNSIDLITYFIKENYSDTYVVVLFDCKTAFTKIPKLNILKRDDYSSYLLGLSNDWVIIEFENVSTAKDYVYSFPIDLQLTYLIFDNGKIVKKEKKIYNYE